MKPAHVDILTYHQPDGIDLKMHILQAKPAKENTSPAIIAFHGGSWIKGEPPALYDLFGHLVRQGITVFLPQYRLINTHEVTILDLIDDARAAVKWVHEHGGQYQLDPKRIGLAGGSAGAHLALNTYLKPIDPPLPKPAFFICGNPVIDSSKSGYGSSFCGEQAESVSPLHQLQPGIPPTLILHGSSDTTTPVEGIRAYTKQAEANGDVCKLIEYEGEVHGFFNRPENHQSVTGHMIEFLKNQGMLASR